MGGVTLPTASTPGYGVLARNDETFVGCDCVIAFLKAAEQLGLARGLINFNIDPVQLTGDVDASGGTHSLGAAFDVRQCTREWSHLFREMGAAGWPRTGTGWVNNEHFHGFIDCPHDERVAYQRAPYWRGYSGLGQATSGTYAGMWGYGSKDPDPWRPTVRRTWREGIAWAEAQIKQLQALEDPLAGITLAQIVEAILEAPIKHPDPKRTDTSQLQAWVTRTCLESIGANAKAAAALARVAALESAFKALAANPDLTPEQITAAAKAGAAAALEERITDADVTLNVAPPSA